MWYDTSVSNDYYSELRADFNKLVERASRIPGVVLSMRTDVKCKTVLQRPETHNLYAVDCAFLMNHDGLHSWET